MNHLFILPAPIPFASLLITKDDQKPASKGTVRPFLNGDPHAARKAYYAKKAEWAKLDLRQAWADEGFMRDHLKAAGIRAPDSTEPATVTRVRSLLRRAGVMGPEIIEAVGTDLPGFLTKNPRLPLWAAVALVLESTSRFTQMHATEQAP